MKLLQRLLKLQPQSSNSWLIVGLGNPGPGYSSNRHNVGQMVLDVLASRIGGTFKSHKANALVLEGKLAGQRVVLAKSTGFMNLSGTPVVALCKFFSIPIEQVLVLHDELDLEFGDIRTKFAGGHAGHNGLRDIIAKISPDFHRVRFGIGRPPGQMEVASFVLQNFSTEERKELPTLLELAADKAEEVISA